MIAQSHFHCVMCIKIRKYPSNQAVSEWVDIVLAWARNMLSEISLTMRHDLGIQLGNLLSSLDGYWEIEGNISSRTVTRERSAPFYFCELFLHASGMSACPLDRLLTCYIFS
jgi:hypothetical protein